jgi:hypothetical protein
MYLRDFLCNANMKQVDRDFDAPESPDINECAREENLAGAE